MSFWTSWLDFRDRCLTSPRFHSFAARFPLTRPIVRKRQSELFDLVSGFVYSQILLACVELDVFARIGSGLSVEALAGRIHLGVDETRRLADGAASLRLLQKHGNVYRLGDLGAALIANPGVIAMIRHHPALYRDLADPTAFLRSGRGETNLSRFWDYARNANPAEVDAEQIRAYSELMTASQEMVAAEINASVDFAPYKVLLDIGGGQGTFISAVAAQNPDLRFQLFDLPAVAERAETTLQESSLTDRVEVFGGSFFTDDLPKGADVISLVRIIHDHDDAQAMVILKAAYETLDDGGTLLLCEPMSSGGQASRISDAYFNFYLYAMGSGRPRSPESLRDMLQSVGFSRSKLLSVRSPLITSVISAHKADR